MFRSNIKRLLPIGITALYLICFTVLPGYAEDKFSCTEVIGFYQSWQWFTGKTMAESSDNKSIPENIFLPDWQGRFEFDAALELWKDKDFKGWTGTFLSRNMKSREKVDRIVFNVSGTARKQKKWAEDILRVAEIINEKYPNVKEIVFQSVIGAEEGECIDVRAAMIHPVIIKAINDAVYLSKSKKVKAGATPKVKDCSHYADQLGNLSAEGAVFRHKLLKDYYSDD